MADQLKGFVPFGEFKPDLRLLANDGLLVCKNVVPVYGSYLSAPVLRRISVALGPVAQTMRGLHVHKLSGFGYAAHGQDLSEVSDAGTVTNRTRTAAANYVGCNDGWTGTSFGNLPVMCPFDVNVAPEPVQYLAVGASRFANLITSTFAPAARYAFALRGNLFLANCHLAAPYDTLSAGYNNTLVAWSRTENIRQFGSFNADPAIVGAGYQPLNYDFGEITGGIAGSAGGSDYGIITFPTGVVRVDGPPYTFQVIDRGTGTVFPYSLVATGSDIWFWGPSGPTKLPGGSGPAESIGVSKFTRTLLDNSTTAFSSMALEANYGTPSYTHVAMAADSTNNLLFVAYRPNAGPVNIFLTYNISEDRLSVFYLKTDLGGTVTDHSPLFIREGQASKEWLPGGNVRFISATGGLGYYSMLDDILGAPLGVNAASPVLQRGYMQLSKEFTTRLLRIRPIYSVSDQAAIEQVSVEIDSTNKPYGTPTTTGPYSTEDSHGWITTPTTVFADFLSPRFTIAANPNVNNIVEYEGFEYEAITGPVYSA